MPGSIGGRWLRELAERCAMGAELAISGGGPPAIERVQNDIKAVATQRGIGYPDLVRAVAREWERRGIVPAGAALGMARAITQAAK